MPYIGNQPGTGVRSRFIYTATASQTTFSGADDNSKTLKYADSAYVDVFLNGVCLVPGTDYTASTKTSVVLTQAASLSDTLEVIAYDIASMSDMSASNGGTFQADVTFADGADIITATAGTDNVRLGEDAGASIVSGGNKNVAIGKNALTANTTADQNTAVGYEALKTNTTTDRHTAIGYQALYANSSGIRNTAIGWSALKDNTSGDRGAAFGEQTLTNNTTGDDNTGLGEAALASNTTGGTNTAVGSSALLSNTTASNNTAVGYKALYTNQTGVSNVAIGNDALKLATTNYNVAVGVFTSDALTTGTFTTALGYGALSASTTGSYNTGVGGYALLSATTGYDNTAVGYTALNGVTTGYSNTSIGKGAGSLITTGAANTIVGRYDGNQGGLDIRTSSNNIVLSDGAGNPRVYVDSSGNMGVGAVSPVGGTIHGQNSSTTLSPFYGVTSSSSYTGNMFKSLAFTAAGTGWNHFIGYGSIGGTTNIKIIGNGNLVNTNNSYGAISDLKLKENIVDSGSQWDDIKALTVRKYSMKADNLDAPNMLGVIAQEVEAAGMGGLVYETPDRDIDDNDLGTVTKQVNYSVLYMKAVKALQEAMTRIEALETKVTALEGA